MINIASTGLLATAATKPALPLTLISWFTGLTLCWSFDWIIIIATALCEHQRTCQYGCYDGLAPGVDENLERTVCLTSALDLSCTFARSLRNWDILS